MDITKLPKWAQNHIRDLERQRDAAVRALEQFCDEQTPASFSVTELVNDGERVGPSQRKRYIQAHQMVLNHQQVELRRLFVTKPAEAPKA